ncbi:hypothetical protein RIF29_28954 [Crotalaria pallida]|uniref:Uncharacterized protein n=1 Tax=Crotalaria pallida TaxID=3830 RepID=A0AAN9EG01_CROPI
MARRFVHGASDMPVAVSFIPVTPQSKIRNPLSLSSLSMFITFTCPIQTSSFPKPYPHTHCYFFCHSINTPSLLTILHHYAPSLKPFSLTQKSVFITF